MRTSKVLEGVFARGRAGIFAATFSIAVLIAMVPSDRAQAQAVYGSIFGTVTDSTGAVVPNATITVTDISKGTSTVVRSDSSGEYRAQHLIPDTYSVSAEAGGFKKVTENTVVVYADTAPKVDLQMVPGATTESVVVTSEAPLLQTEHVDVNTILNQRAVETLPNFNRNFTAFELLTPGTTYIGWNVGQSENPQQSQQIEVQGQLPFATGYELDGTDNQEPVIGVEVINPNLDAVSEMKVTSQNYDAEFGKAVAGLVTAQTKSGSNNFHGSGFEYWRSDLLQARNPFTEFAPDPLTGRFIPGTLHNQFGGSLGGPIVKDKLFFFADYQGLRERIGSDTLTTVPTALAKSSCTSGGPCNLSDYLGVSQIYDPASDENSTANRTPFAGNIIPANRLSAPAVNFLKLIPAPNVAGAGVINNYLASGSGPFNTDQADVRIDDHFSEKLHIFGRYTYFGSDLSGAPYFGAAGGLGFGTGGFAGTDTAHDQSLAAGGDYVISQNWLADFRFGWYKIYLNEEGPNFNQPLGNQLGIPNANVGDLSLNGGLPQFNIDIPSNGSNNAGAIEYGTSANQFDQHASQFQAANNWTHVFGNHNVKFGADLRYGMNHIVGLDNNNVRSGNFHFGAIRTSDTGPGNLSAPGLGFATFLLGDVTSFQRTQTQNTDAAERQKRMFYYAQDQWRVTSKFTLTYGLRWEIYFPESVNGRGFGGLLDLNSGDIRIAGYGPYGNNLNVRNSWDQLAPRLGFAYQIFPKTVVRAGYGRVFGQGWSGNSYGEVLTFSYPTQVSQNLNVVNNGAAVFNLTQGPPGFSFAPIPASGNYPLPDGVGVPTRPTFVRLPTLDSWNLAIQHEITPTMSLQIGYVGSHGIHNMFDSSNQASPNTQTIAGFNDCPAPPAPVVFGYGCTAQDIDPATETIPGDPMSGMPYTQSDRRPYFNGTAQKYLGVKFGAPYGWEQDLRYNANQATSSYNALEVRVDKRFSSGLQFLSHFTWSKALTHESYYFFINPFVGYGPSYYNRPKSFVFAGNYDLPFGRGKMFGGNASSWVNRLIGGFSLNGTLTWQDGLPWTPSYSAGNSGLDNDVVSFLNRTGQSFHTGAGSLNKSTHKVQFFTPAPYVLAPPGQPNDSFGAFARPLVGTFGSWGRDSMIGPGYIDTDLSVAKSIPLKESVNLQFRADFFNLFNHVNLGEPDSCVDCQDGSAGTISGIVSTQDASSAMRRIMLSARIQF